MSRAPAPAAGCRLPAAAQALAESLGLTTAEQIGPPKGKVEPVAQIAARWPASRKFAFNALEPAALSLVASDGPVSVTLWSSGGRETMRFGHNRGVWPARLLRTHAWRDTASTAWDRNPFFFLGTQFRVWCVSEDERDRLAESVTDLIARRAEDEGGAAELMHGFQDLGPDLDLETFELEVHDIAKRLEIATFDDVGLVRWLDAMHARAMAMAEARGRRLTETVLRQQATGNGPWGK